MKNFVLVFFTIVFFNKVSAQSGKFLERAEIYYSNREYQKAIEDYKLYYSKNKFDKKALNFADAYSKSGDLESGIEIYKKYFSLFPLSDSLSLVYADVLKQVGKYDESKNIYQNAQGDKISKQYFNTLALYCDSALIQLSNPSNWDVQNLTHVNTEYSEIAPVRYYNNLVFSSNREGVMIERKSYRENLPLFDLYQTSGGDSIQPKSVSLFSSYINSIHHECCASFSSDYKKIFFTKSFDRPYSNSKGKKNSLKLYSAIYIENKWDSLHTFIFNDTTRSYGHPSIEVNEELFFFASDMEGGYGGTDIYVCFNVEGKWTNPVNLGPHINTSSNELYPFYHCDGTLYFSSNRPEGFGGYDIYFAKENEDGEYAKVKNVGWPVSSSRNDISIFWNTDKTVGYFSSDREGGKGREDIYIILKK